MFNLADNWQAFAAVGSISTTKKCNPIIFEIQELGENSEKQRIPFMKRLSNLIERIAEFNIIQ